jgi:amino acid transporter
MHRVKNKKIHIIAAVMFAVGAMIGGGVFALTGIALERTGPSAIVSFVGAAVMVLFSALSFAVIASEASAKNPGYAYVGKLLGHEIWSFVTSWCFYLSGAIAVAFVLDAFGVYLHDFIAPSLSPIVGALIAAGVLTLVNLGPASEIGKIESLLVGGKLLILLLLIGFGIAHFHVGELTPFIPHGSTQIFTTSAFIFIAFLGFNVITNISSEIKNPRKTIPRAIIISMVVVTIVYVGVVVALLAGGISDYSEASVGIAARHLIGPTGAWLVIIGALISTLSSANANMLGCSEIMVRLAMRKQVPTILGHMRNGHPYVSVLAGTVLYVTLIISGRIQTVINLANVTAIVALIIVDVAAVKALASKTHSGLRLPFGWLLPVLGIAGAALQLFFTPLIATVLGCVLVAFGVGIYALRNRLHIPHLHRQILQTVAETDGPLTRSLK